MADNKSMGRRLFAFGIVLATCLLPVPASDAGNIASYEPPSPWPTEITEPEFPVSLWLTRKSEIVVYFTSVDSTGKAQSFHRFQGEEPYAGLALRALRRWKFDRGFAGEARAEFDFDPDRAVYIEEESRIATVVPQVLVPVPFECPPDPAPELRLSNDLVRMRVEATGFVSDVRFLGKAPSDSISVRATAKRWIFRPFVATDGPRKGRAIPIWAAVRVLRSCGPLGGRSFARPDSLLLADLDAALRIRICSLQPSPREDRTIAGHVDPFGNPYVTLSGAIVALPPDVSV